MQELAAIYKDTSRSPEQRLEDAERVLLSLPQAECPLEHHFGPGVYVRVLRMKAGTEAIGHRQKFAHLNILLQGSVRMLNEDGSTTDLQAPLIFTGQPGRKVGIVLEDMVWLNVYASEERDIDALEAHFVDKSPVWQEAFAQRLGMTASQLPAPWPEQIQRQPNVRVLPSAIQGHGVYLDTPAEPFTSPAMAIEGGEKTLAGRFLNHSDTPNAALVKLPNGDVAIVAQTRIAGPQGGMPGDEVTINFRQATRLLNPKESQS